MTVDSQNSVDALPETMMVTLRIPVSYRMRGFAKLRVPINATEAQIEDALEGVDPVDPEEMEDAVLDDVRGDWGEIWQPEISRHFGMLSDLGNALLRLDAEHNIAPVANQCCSTDSAEEASTLLEEESRYIGFAYLHEQDIDDLLAQNGGVCCIGFGSRQGTDAAAVEVAKLIQQVLLEDGFEVEWDGTADTRLQVRSGN